MQWKSPAVFEKDVKSKSEFRAISTRKTHQFEKGQVMQAAVVPSVSNKPEDNSGHNITINNIQFEVQKGGSKLKRLSSERAAPGFNVPWLPLILPDDPSLAARTPKEATVNGVLFKRSKTGNLLRANAISR